VALAQSKFEASRKDLSLIELADSVVSDVRKQTGLGFGHGQIDSTTVATDDFWDQKTLSDTQYQDILGGVHADQTKTPQDGLQAFKYSAATIMGGRDDVILVLGICKESMIVSRGSITNFGLEPVYHRPLGLDYLNVAALQSRAYMHKYGIPREQCAEVVVKSRKNAQKNPWAMALGEVSVEDVLASDMLASPISVLDQRPVMDGACAILLACEEKARRLTANPVWVAGAASARDKHQPGTRDLAGCPALEAAAGRAYKMAGISDPKKDVDLFELSNEYSYQELLWSEGVGICGPGEGAKLFASGKTRIDGSMPVNTSGGGLIGGPTLVAGLSRVAECVVQLQGNAQGRQVDGAKFAVAQGQSGPAGQLQSVVVLGR
jgi:acetyl-CoA C-acetyltransferase